MESITQLSLSDLAPDDFAPGIQHERLERARLRQKEATKRYIQTDQGKARQLAHQRAWRERQGEAYREKIRLRVRASSRLKRYGVTTDDFDRMLAEQDGVCAICGGDGRGRTLVVDHDHSTGKVRGILCQGCNQALGNMRESPTVLRAGADYLERHST